MEYLTCHGSSALSDFKRQALTRQLGVRAVHGHYVHYVALQEGRPSDYFREHLDLLLTYGDVDLETDSGDDESILTLFISPRQGTSSPWSSKATSIAHVCGLGNIIRIERGTIVKIESDKEYDTELAAKLLHDPMTQMLSTKMPDLEAMFGEEPPAPAELIDLYTAENTPMEALKSADKKLGLALDESELQYLVQAYSKDGPLARSPYDVELFMFAQVNSEHCRHKQFNASWTIDGVLKDSSLFSMIRSTHAKNPRWVVSAYSDNAAVLYGAPGSVLAPAHETGEWKATAELIVSPIFPIVCCV